MLEIFSYLKSENIMDIWQEVVDECTREWLEIYRKGKSDGELGSVFFRMAIVLGLPEGVDDSNPDVIESLSEIRQACGR